MLLLNVQHKRLNCHMMKSSKQYVRYWLKGGAMEREFDKFQEMEIAKIAIEQTEEIVLAMADMVLENRKLREEVERLRKIEKEYHQSIYERCIASEQASMNMLRTALVGVALGKEDLELARELAEFI